VVEGMRAILDPAAGSTESAFFSPIENADAYAAGTITDFGHVGIQAVGLRTIEFRLRAPAPYFIFLLVQAAMSGARAGRPSGAFRVDRLEPDHIVISRDPAHWRAASGNIGIVEWVARERADTFDALLRGEVDVAPFLNPTRSQMDTFANAPVVRIGGAPVVTHYLAFSGPPPYQLDHDMRKALAHAVDRRRLEPSIRDNQMIATGGLVPPGLLGHTPDTALPFNPKLAREYCRRSEHRGPLRVAHSAEQQPSVVPLMASLVDTWREVLQLEIESVDITIHDLVRAAELVHANLEGWAAGYPDPDYFLRMLLYSRSKSNVQHWSSSRFDDLIDRALAQDSSAARLALFHEADRVAVQQECSVIPLFYSRDLALVQQWVKGWRQWSVTWQSFDELIIDERSPRFRGLR
jgi:ABC-type oligopeptide transport system substrate-binding subunit